MGAAIGSPCSTCCSSDSSNKSQGSTDIPVGIPSEAGPDDLAAAYDLPDAEHLSRMIERDFEKIFHQMDTNNDGSLDKKEFKVCWDQLAAKGMMLSTQDSEEVWRKVDQKKDGKIKVDEFRKWMHSECLGRKENLMKALGAKDWMDTIAMKAFKSVDSDGNGNLDINELHAFLAEVSKKFGEKPYTMEEITKTFGLTAAQKTGKQKISRDNFRKTIKEVIVKLYLNAGEERKNSK